MSRCGGGWRDRLSVASRDLAATPDPRKSKARIICSDEFPLADDVTLIPDPKCPPGHIYGFTSHVVEEVNELWPPEEWPLADDA